MAELTRWKEIILAQQFPNSCIAAGFEFLLRYAGLENTIIPEFQRFFEFFPPAGRSTFSSIKNSVVRHYDENEIELPDGFRNLFVRDYSKPDEWEIRLLQMNELIAKDIPFLAVIGSHAAPVIAITDLDITFLVSNEPSRCLYQILVQRVEAYRLDKYQIEGGGGTDMAWMIE